MNGIALTVLISEDNPKLIGFEDWERRTLKASLVDRRRGRRRVGQLGRWNSALGAANSCPHPAGAESCKRFPGILVAMIGATAVAYFFDSRKARISQCSVRCPAVCPRFQFPGFRSPTWFPVIIGGFAVSLVSFADTSVLSRTYAARTGTRVDPNQEMVGLGAANLAAGLFHGFPVSSSSSRTPVAEAAGSRTQLTGVVGALLVALLLLVAPDLLKHVPTAALAAVVISSAIGLFEVNDLKRLFKIQQWEFWLSMVCFAGVAAFGAIPGSRHRGGDRGARVPLGRLASAFCGAWDGSMASGDTTTSRAIHDAHQLPGLVLFRWDAPLFFANAELFKDRALDAVATAPTPGRLAGCRG